MGSRDPRVDAYLEPLPDPDGLITAGHTNTAARTIGFREGDPIAREALLAFLRG
ncbi:hypothetical protein [Leifsonia sp. WHRI 6310E]|uniref:hypothetical protein n=1 Tax=Leifsonia sp. WHRI 6310E TaxID=3162562 RepID=UPI0032F04778